MKNSSTVQDLFTRVNLYLDNELTPDQETQLLRDIQSNPEYLQILSKERAFREFVKSKLQRRKVSTTIIQSIKDKIKVYTPVS